MELALGQPGQLKSFRDRHVVEFLSNVVVLSSVCSFTDDSEVSSPEVLESVSTIATQTQTSRRGPACRRAKEGRLST